VRSGGENKNIAAASAGNKVRPHRGGDDRRRVAAALDAQPCSAMAVNLSTMTLYIETTWPFSVMQM
jgi:hypothetical protein